MEIAAFSAAISALGFYGNTDLTDTTDLNGFSFEIRRF
jgi:hypothetical protein